MSKDFSRGWRGPPVGHQRNKRTCRDYVSQAIRGLGVYK